MTYDRPTRTSDWRSRMAASTRSRLTSLLLPFAAATTAMSDIAAQTQAPAAGRRTRPEVVMDSARARSLYVSNRPEDHSLGVDFDGQIRSKARTDSIYRARSRGVMDFQKISYKSTVDGMTIPAYLFQPINKRGPKGHAAMVWVHGGVHGDWGTTMFPFVREAVERGYVVIAPDYRGSTG